MDVATLREKLHQYIDKADESYLAMFYELAGHADATRIYDSATITMLHERRNRRLQGLGKSFTASESVKLIKTQKK